MRMRISKIKQREFWWCKNEKDQKKMNKLGDRFSKSKTKKIRRNLFEIENKKNLSRTRIKEIEKIFLNK